MKKIIMLIISMSLFGCTSTKKLTNSQTQEGLFKAGISIRECNVLIQELKLDEKSCALIVQDFEPFLTRARELIKKLPLHIQPRINIEKIAIIYKEFPETTDEVLLNKLQEDEPIKKDEAEELLGNSEDLKMDEIAVGDFGAKALPIPTRKRVKMVKRDKSFIKKKIEKIRAK